MTMRPTQPARAHPRSSTMPQSTPTVVLIDGSALFLTVRSLPESRSLDYRALVDLLIEQVPGLEAATPRGGKSHWVMWTAASPQNEGQNRFLDFAEGQLHWEVRRVPPVESFLIDPSQLGVSNENRPAVNRLLRFDAAIAFALGRLVDTHRVIVVSDGYSIAEPLARASAIAGGDSTRTPILSFFGRSLDPRWQRLLLKKDPTAPRFIDLDDHEELLFGLAPSGSVSQLKPSRDGILF